MELTEISRNRICNLPDRRIMMKGKSGTDEGFLQRCRIRTDRIQAKEQSVRETETCRLLACRASAINEKQEAEMERKNLKEKDSLRNHKKESRLKKRMEEADAQVRQCEVQLEQIRIRFAQRQTEWESIYKEIESLYLQGSREGGHLYAVE